MHKKWSTLCIVYLASLSPACLARNVLTAGDRFLAKPVALTQMVRTVRQMMAFGMCRHRGEPTVVRHLVRDPDNGVARVKRSRPWRAVTALQRLRELDPF
jgi:hypothetical protein